MQNRKASLRLMTRLIVVGLPLVAAAPAFAASADVGQINNFIRGVVEALAGIAGLVATGFFVIGGFSYITSSGNPEHLDKAKRTLLFSATGLAIVIAAFVISNIVTQLATSSFGG